MIRRLVSVLIVLAIAYAGYHVGIVFFHDQEFRDAVRNVALFGSGKSDDALKDGVMSAAADNDIPLDRDYIDDRQFPPDEGAGVIVFWAPDE